MFTEGMGILSLVSGSGECNGKVGVEIPAKML